MRLPELQESPGWILSFDFDDTLHKPADDPPVPWEFFDVIRELRENESALWGINTGRSMEHVVEGMNESRFPFLPDWIVAREREVWFPHADDDWAQCEEWKSRCDQDHLEFFKDVGGVLQEIRAQVEEHTGATWIEQVGDPAGIIAKTIEEMDWIVKKSEEISEGHPLLAWQRNSIYLRFGHVNYQKGSCLGHVAKRYGLGPEQCFAIGDGHNDFEMLSSEAAARFACPANAAPEIQEHVRKGGGYLCKTGHGHGVIEALRHFFG